MSKPLEKNAGGRHQILTEEFNKRKVDGGLICNKCKEVRELNEYGKNKTYCIPCKRITERKKYKKAKYKLW
tara:strand:+ start:688 stop:900 length:213 start_codon:yes stop_codon:yes gene_type:complete